MEELLHRRIQDKEHIYSVLTNATAGHNWCFSTGKSDSKISGVISWVIFFSILSSKSQLSQAMTSVASIDQPVLQEKGTFGTTL